MRILQGFYVKIAFITSWFQFHQKSFFKAYVFFLIKTLIILIQENGLGKGLFIFSLGKYPAVISRGSRIEELYNSELVYERHRHRFEVNPDYIREIEGNGMHFSGKSPDGRLMEFLEIPEKTFFITSKFINKKKIFF